MRREERQQRSMLMVMNLEQRVPKEHPLRRIKALAEAVLKELSPTFERMYSATGRPSIPPERLLKASLLMALYTVRSERLVGMRRPTTGDDEPGATRTKPAPPVTEESPAPSRVAEPAHRLRSKDLLERPSLFSSSPCDSAYSLCAVEDQALQGEERVRRPSGTIVQCGRTEG